MTDASNKSCQATRTHRGRHGADDFFIKAVAEGKSVTQAARDAGISRRTACRRIKDPEILRQIDQRRSDLSINRYDVTPAEAQARIDLLLVNAIVTLIPLLDEEAVQIRLDAACTILKLIDELKQSRPDLGLSTAHIVRRGSPDPAETADRRSPLPTLRTEGLAGGGALALQKPPIQQPPTLAELGALRRPTQNIVSTPTARAARTSDRGVG